MKKELARPEVRQREAREGRLRRRPARQVGLRGGGPAAHRTPNLKCIIAPTTVGIAAAGKVLTDKGLQGKVFLTGLGPALRDGHLHRERRLPVHVPLEPDRRRLPRARTRRRRSSRARSRARWATSSRPGRLGDYTITKAPDGGTEVLLGPPVQVRQGQHRGLEDGLLGSLSSRHAGAGREARPFFGGQFLFRSWTSCAWAGVIPSSTGMSSCSGRCSFPSPSRRCPDFAFFVSR